jgi:hypothetical protein
LIDRIVKPIVSLYQDAIEILLLKITFDELEPNVFQSKGPWH